MDAALLRDREAFKKRALANPSVENKRNRTDNAGSSQIKSSASSSSSTYKRPQELSLKSSMASMNASQFKFGVLAKIVRHMRSRHQDGETHALTLHQVLDETNQLNVGTKIKQWLQNNALPNNPKLKETETNSGNWVFNPALLVRDKKSLVKLLRTNDLMGLGGVLMDDIQESVPQHAKVMKIIDKDVLTVTRQTDKKQIVFYHDKSLQFPVDSEFQQLWRNSSVDGMHDDNIDEYLTKQGIKSMKDGQKAFSRPFKRKAKARRSQPTKITDNDHLAHVLKNYDTEQ